MDPCLRHRRTARHRDACSGRTASPGAPRIKARGLQPGDGSAAGTGTASGERADASSGWSRPQDARSARGPGQQQGKALEDRHFHRPMELASTSAPTGYLVHSGRRVRWRHPSPAQRKRVSRFAVWASVPRVTVAGLQRKAAGQGVNRALGRTGYGLEPHRIARFLGSLGARRPLLRCRCSLTTHSPVALREPSGGQLFVLAPRPSATRPAWWRRQWTSRARSAPLSRGLSWLAPWSCARSQRDRSAARPGLVPGLTRGMRHWLHWVDPVDSGAGWGAGSIVCPGRAFQSLATG